MNGGIKLGPLGVPSNFKEGMAILARPSLRLRRHDVWKLSGPFGLFGDDLPSQVLLPLGGNRTLRGSPQDRFLDKSHLLVNAEIRFPIVGSLGGVVGLDLGKVWPSLGSIDVREWAANPTIGLRYYMKTFVVRMDVGLGADATGLYFNFRHIF